MRSGCGYLIADKSPSSATQLPILAALHAGSPTLFAHIIHHKCVNVNTFFYKAIKLYRIGEKRSIGMRIPRIRSE